MSSGGKHGKNDEPPVGAETILSLQSTLHKIELILRPRVHLGEEASSDAPTFSEKQIQTILAPLEKLATEILHKVEGIRDDRQNAKVVEILKNKIFFLCELLREDPLAYILFDSVDRTPAAQASGGGLDFREQSSILTRRIETLRKTMFDRIETINSITEEINKMRESSREALLSPLSLRKYETIISSSPSIISTYEGKYMEQRTKREVPAAGPAKDKSKTHEPSPKSLKMSSTGEPVSVSLKGDPRFANELALTIPVLHPTDVTATEGEENVQESLDDLSTDHIQALREILDQECQMRDQRITLIRQLATDVVQLWRENGQLPSATDSSISERDRRILLYIKSATAPRKDSLSTGRRGSSICADDHNAVVPSSSVILHELAAKKKELLVTKEDRVRGTLEMSKRLKLIEDRQALLGHMRKFEAQAKNPLRLFGDSTLLAQEQRFREKAYPRLLMLEAVLRPALMLYKERQGRPFLYKGTDYLAMMDDELRSRSVPREIFPLAVNSADTEKSIKENLELFVGRTTIDPDDVYKGMDECIAKVCDEKQSDFARILLLGTRVEGSVAERFMEEAKRDTKWMEGGALSEHELIAKTEERKLLSLGWQLPKDFTAGQYSRNPNLLQKLVQQKNEADAVPNNGSKPGSAGSQPRQVHTRKNNSDTTNTAPGPPGSASIFNKQVKENDGKRNAPGSYEMEEESQNESEAEHRDIPVPPKYNVERKPCRSNHLGEGKHCPGEAEKEIEYNEIQRKLLKYQPPDDKHSSNFRRGNASELHPTFVEGEADFSSSKPDVSPHKQNDPPRYAQPRAVDGGSAVQPKERVFSDDVFSSTDPLLLPPKTLLPTAPAPPNSARVKVQKTQLERMRQPRHVRLEDMSENRKLIKEMNEAFKYKGSPDFFKGFGKKKKAAS